MSDIQKALEEIRKIFGQDSVGSAKDLSKIKNYLSTGSLQLDAVLGGGFPRGRLVELFGPEGSGKTTLALHAIADAQSKGLGAIFADQEGTFDEVYANALGVDIDKLIYIPPCSGEDMIQIIEKLCKTGEIAILVIDSIASMLPIKVSEGDPGNANMSAHAKLVGTLVKRLVPIQYKNDICIIATNQLRDKPGVTFGNPEYSTGGNSVKFYAGIRIDIRKSGSVSKDDNGNVVSEPRKIKVVKSKINASTNKVLMVDIIYGEGFDQIGEVIDVGVEGGIIVKSGAWYSYNNAKIGQGREATKQFLRDNPEAYEEIKSKVVEKLKGE